MPDAIGESASSTPDPPFRKLVTLRRISDLRSLKQTRYEIASLDGWNVVVPQESYTVGELIVYFEIDCFLPGSDDRFWEYAASQGSQYYEGKHGYVVRTIMKHNRISQGIIMPLNTFPEINVKKRENLTNIYRGDLTQVEKALTEPDYAVLLNVRKFEQRFVDDEARIHGSSPIFLPQPGCDRSQNVVNLFQHYGDREFAVSEKLDGVPLTIYSVDVLSQWYNALPCDRDSQGGRRPGYGICGRYVDYAEDDEYLLWRTIRNQGIIEKIHRIGKHWKSNGNNFAIQGEFCGHFILGNSMGFGPGEHHFYAFGIYDIDNQRWLPQERMMEICKKLKIDHAPFIARTRLRDFAKGMDELLEKAEGKGVLGNKREGLVFKTIDQSFCFKVIANSWLLEYGHQKNSPDQW